MRISDWSSDVCSSDLLARQAAAIGVLVEPGCCRDGGEALCMGVTGISAARIREGVRHLSRLVRGDLSPSSRRIEDERSEEHTSELQSLMRSSYAVFCLKKRTRNRKRHDTNTTHHSA